MKDSPRIWLVTHHGVVCYLTYWPNISQFRILIVGTVCVIIVVLSAGHQAQDEAPRQEIDNAGHFYKKKKQNKHKNEKHTQKWFTMLYQINTRYMKKVEHLLTDESNNEEIAFKIWSNAIQTFISKPRLWYHIKFLNYAKNQDFSIISNASSETLGSKNKVWCFMLCFAVYRQMKLNSKIPGKSLVSDSFL